MFCGRPSKKFEEVSLKIRGWLVQASGREAYVGKSKRIFAAGERVDVGGVGGGGGAPPLDIEKKSSTAVSRLFPAMSMYIEASWADMPVMA